MKNEFGRKYLKKKAVPKLSFRPDGRNLKIINRSLLMGKISPNIPSEVPISFIAILSNFSIARGIFN